MINMVYNYNYSWEEGVGNINSKQQTSCSLQAGMCNPTILHRRLFYSIYTKNSSNNEKHR